MGPPPAVPFSAAGAVLVAPADAGRHIADIASANWFASASVVGKAIGSALFMDMGSTTTDIVPVLDGAVAGRGYTDAERLTHGELVYTGLVRSFLMATADRKSTRLNSSHANISYAVFCLKKKKE